MLWFFEIFDFSNKRHKFQEILNITSVKNQPQLTLLSLLLINAQKAIFVNEWNVSFYPYRPRMTQFGVLKVVRRRVNFKGM